MLIRITDIDPEIVQARKNYWRNLLGRSGILASKYPRLEPMLVRAFVMKEDCGD
jgi:hypothetical protein